MAGGADFSTTPDRWPGETLGAELTTAELCRGGNVENRTYSPRARLRSSGVKAETEHASTPPERFRCWWSATESKAAATPTDVETHVIDLPR